MAAMISVLTHLVGSTIRALRSPAEHITMEEKSLQEGFARVKFASTWKGTITDFLAANSHLQADFKDTTEAMSSGLWELEECGATPVCLDGKVGGNAAAVLGENRLLIVSKSGKLGGQRMHPMKDVCIVSHFDTEKWSAEFYAESKDILPTSDTPLHFAALNAHFEFGWLDIPNAGIHGHALETVEAAERVGLPISQEETLFSTKADTDALLDLMKVYSFPTHMVYIRKGHGFVIIGGSMAKVMDAFTHKIKPFI